MIDYLYVAIQIQYMYTILQSNITLCLINILYYNFCYYEAQWQSTLMCMFLSQWISCQSSLQFIAKSFYLFYYLLSHRDMRTVGEGLGV